MSGSERAKAEAVEAAIEPALSRLVEVIVAEPIRPAEVALIQVVGRHLNAGGQFAVQDAYRVERTAALKAA